MYRLLFIVIGLLGLLSCGESEDGASDFADMTEADSGLPDGDFDTEDRELRLLPSHLELVPGLRYKLTLLHDSELAEGPEWTVTGGVQIEEGTVVELIAVEAGEFTVSAKLDGLEATMTGVVRESKWKEVFVGGYSTCALTHEGKLYCVGQVGALAGEFAFPLATSTPVELSVPEPVKDVALDFGTMCILGESGSVFCRGENTEGQVGDRTRVYRTSWRKVDVDAPFTEIQAGSKFFCGLTDESRMWCWGTLNHLKWPVPRSIAGGPWDSMGVGDWHVCAIKDGDAYCWGNNIWGQLGMGDQENRDVPTKVVWSSNSPRVELRQVMGGRTFTCGLGVEKVHCWGDGEHHVLGYDPRDGYSFFPSSTSISRAEKLSSAYLSSCIVTDQKKGVCWGSNKDATLGNGAKGVEGKYELGETLWQEISMGDFHACGLTYAGEIACWGADFHGQVGSGRDLHIHQPKLIGAGFKRVESGINHTCAVRTNGDVVCWGENALFQVSSPNTTWFGMTTANVPPATDVATTRYGTCALVEGQMSCWGLNHSGELGAETYSLLQVPSEPKFGPFDEIVGGTSTILARDPSDWWYIGNAGSKTLSPYSLVRRPYRFPEILHESETYAIEGVSLGSEHACALLRDQGGLAYCFGSDELGRLGPNRSSAGRAPLPGTYTEVSAGWAHTCGQTTQDEVNCFGFFGREDVYGTTPFEVSGTFQKLSSRGPFTCGIKEGEVFCWGSNDWGNTGVPASDSVTNATRVSLPSFATDISTGFRHACALVGDEIWCWGDDSYGQITASTHYVLSPTVWSDDLVSTR